MTRNRLTAYKTLQYFSASWCIIYPKATPSRNNLTCPLAPSWY